MAQYEHMSLLRLPERFERRKHPAPVPAKVRQPVAHGEKLRGDLANSIRIQNERRNGVTDPSLIFRVQMVGLPQEEDWEKLGLNVVEKKENGELILFSVASELTQLAERFDAYEGEIPAGQKNPPYNNFFASIEKIEDITPSEKIGPRLVNSGFDTLGAFLEATEYLIDLEIWDIADRLVRESRLEKIADFVGSEGGIVYDTYVGPSTAMLRAKCKGDLIRLLLNIGDVSVIDSPPIPDLKSEEMLDLTIAQIPEYNELAADAPIIGIIDSGLNAHPLLADITAGVLAFPKELGSADVWGHGTRVAGVAAFGDLNAQIQLGMLSRGSRLCAAKVINDQGRFDDKSLVAKQMREAIEGLHIAYGCKIFVISLADITRPYKGGKVGAWTAALDNIARELDVLIVVSAGNRMPRSGLKIEEAITQYPGYLLEDENKIFEPAAALNVLSVGSIAHGEGINGDQIRDLSVKAITLGGEPSPFSRVGPGVGGCIKPDLMEIGGTLIYDGVAAKLKNGYEIPSAGILTTHHKYLDRLFASASGTSYAAPRVAFSASQILTKFPKASANLMRALLVNSATVPKNVISKLKGLGKSAVQDVCGNGQPDLERAAFSEDSRVIFYSEDNLKLDHFAIYHLPIPLGFKNEPGDRIIKITLAFNPPVRNSRIDYAGFGMSFRLIRGCKPEKISEHYRRRTKAEGPFPDMESKFDCSMEPKSTVREKGTVQSAVAIFKRNIGQYGNDYYVVVKAEGGWFDSEEPQSFAVVVEIAHLAGVKIYEQLQERVRIRS
jgi:subtilisin family serine protease